MVFDRLKDAGQHSFVIIDGFLQFYLTENPGAAFGIAAGKRYMLIAVSLTALIVVIVIFLLSRKSHAIVHISLAMFAAGVCGNLYDRLFPEGSTDRRHNTVKSLIASNQKVVMPPSGHKAYKAEHVSCPS